MTITPYLDAARRNTLKAEARTARAAFEVARVRVQTGLASIDPALPASTQEIQAARIRREFLEAVDLRRVRLRTIADALGVQFRTNNRAAHFRRAGVACPASVASAVRSASDELLVLLARDAAAGSDYDLAGAVSLELASRSLSPEHQQAIGAALEAVDFPEVASIAKDYQVCRDLHLQSELEVLDVAPPAGSPALQRMMLGRELETPVHA